MAKKTLANAITDRDVDEFIADIPHQGRKADSAALLKIIQELTGLEPHIWGKSIVGFGRYDYQRKNGDTYEWFNVGFSPGKNHMTVYLMFDLEQEQEILEKLGPHRHGRGCLYIKKLEDVELEVLKELILKSKKWSN